MLNKFENYLYEKVNENIPSYTKKAMSYSLMNGGKRIRPQLLFNALQGYGIDPELGFPCACAIEMIHTYSLIHDDLPAMDNDDMRRGKPTCHKAYGESYAILAGDGLLTKAFEVVLETKCDASILVKLVRALSQYAGIDGMIYGQDLDLHGESEEHPSFSMLMDIDEYKTAKLLTLPLICAAYMANMEEDIKTLKKIGFNVGIQFQIVDDILDVTSNEQILGKTTSDVDNNKMTAVSLLGLEKAKQMVEEYDMQLKEDLKNLHMDTSHLEKLFNFLLKRTY